MDGLYLKDHFLAKKVSKFLWQSKGNGKSIVEQTVAHGPHLKSSKTKSFFHDLLIN